MVLKSAPKTTAISFKEFPTMKKIRNNDLAGDDTPDTRSTVIPVKAGIHGLLRSSDSSTATKISKR